MLSPPANRSVPRKSSREPRVRLLSRVGGKRSTYVSCIGNSPAKICAHAHWYMNGSTVYKVPRVCFFWRIPDYLYTWLPCFEFIESLICRIYRKLDWIEKRDNFLTILKYLFDFLYIYIEINLKNFSNNKSKRVYTRNR